MISKIFKFNVLGVKMSESVKMLHKKTKALSKNNVAFTVDQYFREIVHI